MDKGKIIGIVVVLILAVGAIWGLYYATKSHSTQVPALSPTPTSSNSSQKSLNTQLPNPAGKYCVEKGGKVITKKLGNGAEYGVCDFGDGRYCEEWALFNDDCPVGGVKLTGYDTEAQKYCALIGGEVDMNANTCTKKGKSCDLDQLYNGKCSL